MMLIVHVKKELETLNDSCQKTQLGTGKLPLKAS